MISRRTKNPYPIMRKDSQALFFLTLTSRMTRRGISSKSIVLLFLRTGFASVAIATTSTSSSTTSTGFTVSFASTTSVGSKSSTESCRSAGSGSIGRPPRNAKEGSGLALPRDSLSSVTSLVAWKRVNCPFSTNSFAIASGVTRPLDCSTCRLSSTIISGSRRPRLSNRVMNCDAAID